KKSKPKAEKTKKKPTAVSLLSFDDDDEEIESFQLKKSSRSKRIAKKIKKRAQEEKDAESNPDSVQIKPSKLLGDNAQEVHIFRPKAITPDRSANDSPFKAHVMGDIKGGAIPSPSMIHAARKQREMLRKYGSEFIPVDDTQTYKENKSRLVREDDFDNSSDDDIIEMRGIKSNTTLSTQPKKFVPNESEESDMSGKEDELVDEEVNRWEEELIKKGTSAQPQIPVQIDQSYLYQSGLQQPGAYDIGSYGYADPYYGAQQNVIPVSNVEAKSNVTFELIKKRLSEHLTSIQEVHRSHEAEMNSVMFDTNDCTEMSKNLSDSTTLSDEYRFYQETKDYVKNLVGCLREKVPDITNMEKSANDLWKSNSDNIISRRIQDVRDESSQCTSVKSTFDKGSQQDAELTQRIREREARRTRRRAERQIRKRDTDHHDGFSTDDEVTSMDQAKNSAEVNRIEKESSELFEDVVEEFCDIKCVLKHFETWRAQHSNSYNDAYIALCIPKLLVPFIRHATILWNPLKSDSPLLENSDWFKTLSSYGLHCLEDKGEDANMDDTKVLANIFEKVILHKVIQLVKETWDPLSRSQTLKVVDFMNNISGYSFMTSDNQRQTWSSIKLFENAMLLHDFLSYEVLSELVFDSLLNRYILLALQTSALTKSSILKCKQILSAIPKQWFSKYPDLLCHLSTLTRFLEHFAKSVSTSSAPSEILLKKKANILLLEI
uniref:GCF C-terminal domain-containing protein n=1 Tax=Ciona savignyi TaxID=51511 RepID=H2YE17_CIOSA